MNNPQIKSREQIQQEEMIAQTCKELLTSDTFKFLRDYIEYEQKQIVQDILQNRLKKLVNYTAVNTEQGVKYQEVHQEKNDLLEQYIGRYNAFNDLVNFLNFMITNHEQTKEAIEKGLIKEEK